jgi:hypothetical protein
MTHVFDTRSVPGGPWYVNDHSLVQGPGGAWHLFGIFHREPMLPDDSESDFIHAVAEEPDPAKWVDGSFLPARDPIALRADRARGETHLWAPHVVAAGDRYVMIYQGGGSDDDHASFRVAESEDLDRWTRRSAVAFEDFCNARDPMLVRHDAVWHVYYTRCESLAHKISGVAHRASKDLVHWSEPQMALTAASSAPTSNSAFTESPFVFERKGAWYMSVTAYPVEWDVTLLYRSRSPLAFEDAPFARLRAHAGEWIFDRRGRAYITHAGPGQYGVWLATVDGL